jgi:enoyl-CoA hydratase/carnithine racemase
MVVASPMASFGLPEATVGLYAAAGGLPRIVRNCGLQIASEVAMTGRRLTPQEVETCSKTLSVSSNQLIIYHIGFELSFD